MCGPGKIVSCDFLSKMHDKFKVVLKAFSKWRPHYWVQFELCYSLCTLD